MFRNVQYRLELRDALGSMGPAAATTAAAQNNQLDLYNSTAARQAYSTMERSQSAPVPSSVLDTEQYAPGVQKSRVQVRAEARNVLTGLSQLLKRKLLIACCRLHHLVGSSRPHGTRYCGRMFRGALAVVWSAAAWHLVAAVGIFRFDVVDFSVVYAK
jgi:hypothetical protein